jgi:hypothetical protein
LAQNTNVAVQVAQDTVVGTAKSGANFVIDAANMVNKPIDALLSHFTSFQFGQMPDLQGSTPGEKSAMAGVFLVSFLTGEGEVSAASRASELAAAMGKTKNFVTITVTDTQEGTRVISSSESALRPAVRALLGKGEVAASGAGQAEVTGVNAARQMGLTPTGVAASRGICPSCAQFLHDLGVAALSLLK